MGKIILKSLFGARNDFSSRSTNKPFETENTKLTFPLGSRRISSTLARLIVCCVRVNIKVKERTKSIKKMKLKEQQENVCE